MFTLSEKILDSNKSFHRFLRLHQNSKPIYLKCTYWKENLKNFVVFEIKILQIIYNAMLFKILNASKPFGKIQCLYQNCNSNKLNCIDWNENLKFFSCLHRQNNYKVYSINDNKTLLSHFDDFCVILDSFKSCERFRCIH